jgi:hypothetical protein
MTGSTGLVRGTVIRAHLVNDPIDRLDEILARQVNTPEKFLRFLALLLGLSDPSALIGDQTNAIGVGDAFKDRPGSGVLELVMRALVDNPESLIDLDRLVQRLQATDSGRSILPEGFDELWASVKLALALSSEATL